MYQKHSYIRNGWKIHWGGSDSYDNNVFQIINCNNVDPCLPDAISLMQFGISVGNKVLEFADEYPRNRYKNIIESLRTR